MISEKLKPCPVCGHTNPQYEYGIHVICPSCGLSFPTDEEHAAEVWNSLPRKLRWTKEKPNREGWYWVKLFFEFRTEKRIVHVKSLFDGSFELYFTDGEDIFDVSNALAEWAGPIPEPEE